MIPIGDLVDIKENHSSKKYLSKKSKTSGLCDG